MKIDRREGYQLFQDGAIALAQMEANGIRIDVERLQRTKAKLAERIRTLKTELEASDTWKIWRKRYGAKANIQSGPQLGVVLFDILKLESKRTTATGKHSTDEAALQDIDDPFVQKLVRRAKLKKALNTYLKGIEIELVGDRVHPVFNLHFARSFRSSADSPNLQNVPVRDEGISKIIRSLFIASDDCVLVENDFKGIEVGISATYHKDPNFISYITTPGRDMHRDMAAQLYLLKQEDVSKESRYGAKNRFVFPQFYGDYYINCAKALWDWATRGKLKGPGGMPLLDHLRDHGICELGACDPEQEAVPGTFEHHVREVEYDFWTNRFPEYKKWKRDGFELYLKRGYFDFHTGFRVYGNYKRNQVNNYPVQGCLRKGSLVLTESGLHPIETLVGKVVSVWTGFGWSGAIGICKGMFRAAEIELDSGIIIKCDTRHKLKNHLCEWAGFDKLKVGDYIALPKCSDAVLPSKCVNWWFLLGFIVGDGCISGNRNRKGVAIRVGDRKLRDLKKMHSFLIDQGFKDDSYGGVHFRKTSRGMYELTFESSRMTKILEEYGLKFGTTAHTKRIPSKVWTASAQARRDFLEGLWRSDGGRGYGQLRRLHMCNKELLKEVQIMASSLGFDSALAKTPTGWRLSMVERGKNKKPVRRYPTAALKKFVGSVSRKRYSDTNQFVTDKRNFKSGKDITQFVAERILEKNAPRSEIYRFDRIKSIRVLESEEMTYTMSVDDPLHQFVADGVIHKNSAFHCLLWSIIQIQKILTKQGMKAKLVGQIHDSLLGDVPTSELRDYLEIIERVVTVDLRKHYRKWLNVPLEIEYEICPPGKSWFHKQEFKFRDGYFVHPDDPKKRTGDVEKFLATL